MERIYDEDGKQWAFLDDRYIFDSYEGHMILWIWGRHLFTWKGEHVGWYEDGWLWDHDGHAVGHIESAEGGPARAKETEDMNRSLFPERPESWPRRQGLFTDPEVREGWALLNGRTFFTTFVESSGDAKDEAHSAWEAVRDRVAASLEGGAGGATAEGGAPAEPSKDADTLAALNAAISAYRAAMGDDDALVSARADLSEAAERYAIEGGAELE